MNERIASAILIAMLSLYFLAEAYFLVIAEPKDGCFSLRRHEAMDIWEKCGGFECVDIFTCAWRRQ